MWRHNEQAYLQCNVPIATVFGQQLDSTQYQQWKHFNGNLWELLPMRKPAANGSSQVQKRARKHLRHANRARRFTLRATSPALKQAAPDGHAATPSTTSPAARRALSPPPAAD
jgi:hypothetical protein